MKALVIGGTGPTGPCIVHGLLARGYQVAILHTGRHEVPEIPASVEHIHTDPYEPRELEQALEGRRFSLCIVTYGRLRRIAEIMVGRCERFISVGGGPSYRGYMNPGLLVPAGLPVPTSEDAPRVEKVSEDEKGYRIARTEDAVMTVQPHATHFRYPIVYGPRQLMPREWCIVRRILDGRRHIILPDEGLTLVHCGYIENLAHALMLAVDHPEVASGKIYNCADEECLTLRQTVESIAEALDHDWEIVSMPWALAKPARPLVMQPLPTHRVFDLGRLRGELVYTDVVPPREALAITARWLCQHRPEPGGVEETVLEDPFDYAAEDALIRSWQQALAGVASPDYAQEPGYTLSYSGPGGRQSSSRDFE
jgi:nucleoside-diphosphate-sugar epimerase